ncbi:hypothetical protein [Thermanaerothrix sp.]|uniref:hypothetical protein n=1 Tax=Thermanaerothrix sp. TaxID=2972675 RepID=UPI002ADD8722|nr:hypothetical protein [Thermanaerothrix sp.]
MNDFPESDWKILSRLKPLALERLCLRILHQIQAYITTMPPGASHSTYLAIYRFIHEQDRLIAAGFNHWSRSRAFEHLLIWRRHALLTEDEFASFSAETRQRITSALANLRD